MNKIFVVVLSAGLFGILIAQSAEGQLIRIFDGGGNVSVRAPFVRVNVDPWGNTHVRAPFVNVYSPPGYYQPFPRRYVRGYPAQGVPVYSNPQPSGVPVTAPAANSPSIVGPSETAKPVPPDPPGFHSVLEPNRNNQPRSLVQQRRVLAAKSQALERSLARYSNAEAWQKFLRLPTFVFDDSTDANLAGAITAKDEQSLKKMLDRFDRTAGRADYHLVTNLPGFKQTHEDLRKFTESVRSATSSSREELPPPSDKK